jgi:hypothetical protein
MFVRSVERLDQGVRRGLNGRSNRNGRAHHDPQEETLEFLATTTTQVPRKALLLRPDWYMPIPGLAKAWAAEHRFTRTPKEAFA